MHITKQTIIGELVAREYRTASVFKENGIDFCCNGNRTIQEACNQKQIESDGLIAHLESLKDQDSGSSVNYNSWPLDLLADYIEKIHHRYVQKSIQEISTFLEKIVSVHGKAHPELSTIAQLFADSAGELTAHMKKEELILFPYIRQLEQAKHSATKLQAAFGSVQHPIRMMMHEHDTEGERFRKINALTGSYHAPLDACNTYKVTYSLLKEFEDDLHLHIHLENNILFPKSIGLEESLQST
ncbi:iron-sulfur cluster repair di-iron protein [Pedobacter ginsengisoli]|uniref:iron-sulfur cluster repair di-iron protein n=1 Tax=Pedobacter ginsengisoli TaxID=363852 RepID=UPI00254AE0D1|nr:iron-sulfur cluster repair di-iron protein [Pedobacter ginsengisoli]